mmetsp:Transcript_25333/g.69800  ORF Transcript_25333/g.69800 Transcript_25333/m.69800 type:complete len:732 (+) Transcript_25333:694-2889(+)
MLTPTLLASIPGLTDGNFAVWDLASNQTFMSRKHFAGKHKGGITCGDWGPEGDTLALGSANQLKISQPLHNAAWDQTATKLYLPTNADTTGGFQQLIFSQSGLMLAAFAGSSVFRHLCLYAVVDLGKRGLELVPVGEMHPSPSVGSLQSAIWLEGDVMLVITSNGLVRFMLWDRHECAMVEEQFSATESGVVGAVRLPSGHIAIARGAKVILWDPVTRQAAAVVDLPPLPRTVRLIALEAAASVASRQSDGAVIVGRSDGEITRVPLPHLAAVDIALVRVNRSGGYGAAVAELSSGKPLEIGTPTELLRVNPDEGAMHTRLEPLRHAWSPETQQLAFINSNTELYIFSTETGKCMLRNPLPQAPCTFLRWDPGTGKTLALTLRGNGVGIWSVESGADVKMWTGMQATDSLMRLSADSKSFDPTSACWSRAGQLAIGMSDGSFAVWDSVSSQVSTPSRSGKHKAGITAGDWIDSLFAPALALASRDTIKISKGFETAEWGATAIKLKLGRASSRNSLGGDGVTSPLSKLGSSSSSLILRKARTDPEGLEFIDLKFSSGGKYLAVLAYPAHSPHAKQIVVYEVQDSRETLVAVREYVGNSEDDRPFAMGWVGGDHSLMTFSQGMDTGCVRAIIPTGSGSSSEPSWPADGEPSPGRMSTGACTATGLVVALFDTAGGGLAVLFDAKLQVLSRITLPGVPQSMSLHAPPIGGAGVGSCHTMSVSFEAGGVQVWKL